MSLELQNINKIIIIDLAFIGDIILATPVTRALKENFPHAEITMMTVPLTAPIAEMNPYVDKVLVYDKKGEHKGLFGMWKAAKLLKPHKFDLAVCMNFATRGAVVSWLAGIPYRLGYDAQHADWFLTCAQSHIRDGIKHETLNHLEVLRPLNISTEDTSLEFVFTPEIKSTYEKKLKEHGIPKNKYIAVCPFGNNIRREMSINTISEVAQHFKEYIFCIVGSKNDYEKMKYLKGDNILLLAGTFSLKEVPLLLKNSLCTITVDSGPLHMAQAVKSKTIAIFGPAAPEIWGPRGKNDIVLQKKRSCYPCDNVGVCVGESCTKDINSDDIITAINKILEN